jgi:RimJ/RimL family protein N-acetyltransferase
MPHPIPTLHGTRITMRPPDPAVDAIDYYEMNRDPDMHAWTGNHVLASVQDAETELQRFVDMPDVSTWMIVDNASGRVMGRFFLCLEERDGERVVGEGNRIAKPFWRRGHNREARRLLLPYIFDTLAADRIETACWAENVNSVRSIEAHGFRFTHEEPRWNAKHDREMMMRCYAMTRMELSNSRGSGA